MSATPRRARWGAFSGIVAVGGSIVTAVAVGVSVGCASRTPFEASRTPYDPTRRDYGAFRASLGERARDLLDPNYLPFMVHRFRTASEEGEGADGDLLVLCRWPDTAMPLDVHVAIPDIPETLQYEFHRRPAGLYVEGVYEALAMWERELEGLAAFRRVDSPDEAELDVQLLPEAAPAEQDRKVLGMIQLQDACRPRGWAADGPGNAGRLDVDFSVPPLRIYLADEFGLLTPDQVKWIALHEIGHALGMRSHSPIPADLMYEMVRDAVVVPGLSVEDVNSFVSLYQLPNGTVFGRARDGDPGSQALGRPEDAALDAEPPSGGLELSIAPYVDTRLGFEFHPPRDWLRVETRRGMVAIDGLTWDSSASLQVIVEPFDTVDDYLERYAAFFLSHGRLRFYGRVDDVAGYPAVQAIIETHDGAMLEEVTLVEVGDGRIIVTIADCRIEHAETYLAWFRAARASLEIWSEPDAR